MIAVPNYMEVPKNKTSKVTVAPESSRNINGQVAEIAVIGQTIDDVTSPDAKQAAIDFAATEYRFFKAAVDGQITPVRWVDEKGEPTKAAAKGTRACVVYKIRNGF